MSHQPIHGRGAAVNPPNRFAPLYLEPDPDYLPEEAPLPRTKFYRDLANTIITYNESPDIGFSASLNVYRGCEHGCAYCYARPSHEYLGLSAGLDFETKIMVKTDAPNLLRRELSHPRWSPQTLAMSGVTDCYQPVERSLKLTRQCLEVLADFRNPVGLVTKNHLVTRDLDILQELHRYECVKVYISITSLQSDLAGVLEPRAARPAQRLEIVRQLASAGVPVGVIIAPVIPGLNDVEIPALLEAAAAAGAGNAHYVLLRLPHAVKDIFSQWLENHYPEKKDRVLGLIRETREGRLNQTDFGTRMKGTGAYAQHIEDLFRVSKKRVGLGRDEILSTRHFRRPGLATQLALL